MTISEEACRLQLDSIHYEIRRLAEMHERAPLGSAYRDDLRAKLVVLTDRLGDLLAVVVDDGERRSA